MSSAEEGKDRARKKDEEIEDEDISAGEEYDEEVEVIEDSGDDEREKAGENITDKIPDEGNGVEGSRRSVKKKNGKGEDSKLGKVVDDAVGEKPAMDVSDSGEENERKPERKKLEPFEVPKSGAFFLHDDRRGEAGGGRWGSSEDDELEERGRGKLWSGVRNTARWSHDGFEQLQADDGAPGEEGSCRIVARRGARGVRGGARVRGGYLQEAGNNDQVPPPASYNQARGRDGVVRGGAASIRGYQVTHAPQQYQHPLVDTVGSPMGSASASTGALAVGGMSTARTRGRGIRTVSLDRPPRDDEDISEAVKEQHNHPLQGARGVMPLMPPLRDGTVARGGKFPVAEGVPRSGRRGTVKGGGEEETVSMGRGGYTPGRDSIATAVPDKNANRPSGRRSGRPDNGRGGHQGMPMGQAQPGTMTQQELAMLEVSGYHAGVGSMAANLAMVPQFNPQSGGQSMQQQWQPNSGEYGGPQWQQEQGGEGAPQGSTQPPPGAQYYMVVPGTDANGQPGTYFFQAGGQGAPVPLQYQQQFAQMQAQVAQQQGVMVGLRGGPVQVQGDGGPVSLPTGAMPFMPQGGGGGGGKAGQLPTRRYTQMTFGSQQGPGGNKAMSAMHQHAQQQLAQQQAQQQQMQGNR